jgi:uncharacterized membrane protein YccC
MMKLQSLSQSFYETVLKADWLDAVRGTLVTAVLVTLPIMFAHPNYAIPLSIGAVFAAISEAGQPYGDRWRTMLFTTLGMMFTTYIGSLLSDTTWLAVIFTAPVAFVSAYVGIFGKRAAVGGLLSLIVFTIYVGTPVPIDDARMHALLMGIGGFAQTIVTLFTGWALGQHRQKNDKPPPIPLAQRFDDTAMFTHAFRLMLLLSIATAISENISMPHPYWLPMSIAWMSKLGRYETFVRVAHRVIGTVLGILLAVATVLYIPPDAFGFPLFTLIGVFFVIAFIWVNYAIAVAGVTMWIILLLGIVGDPIIPTVHIRLLATFVAAIFVIGGVLLIKDVIRSSQSSTRQ